jgi:hypothetical protein
LNFYKLQPRPHWKGVDFCNLPSNLSHKYALVCSMHFRLEDGKHDLEFGPRFVDFSDTMRSIEAKKENDFFLQHQHLDKRTLMKMLFESKEQVETLEGKVNNNRHLNLDVEMIVGNDEMCAHYTGFNDYATFDSVFQVLEPSASQMVYINSRKHKNISLVNQFFMTCFYLRHHHTYFFLSKMFRVSTTAAASIVKTWARLMMQMYDELFTFINS